MAWSKLEAGKPAAKVLIVDDHPAVREALAIRIAQTPDLRICGEAADIAEALQLIESTQPDVAVIDITLKSGDGIDLIKRIKARGEKIRLLVWSMHSESLYAERALRAGALGYITKEQATDRIVETIRQVLAGKVFLSPAMSEQMLHRAVGEREQSVGRSPVNTLADRELQVFRLLGQAVNTLEIAKRLHLSVKTIETYRNRIRQKLELSNAAELVRHATKWVMENP